MPFSQLLPLALLKLALAFSFDLTSVPTQCDQLHVNITEGSGTPPYSALVVPFGASPVMPDWRAILSHSFDDPSTSFQMTYPANSDFVIAVGDANGIGTGGTSIPTNVVSSNDTSCLPSSDPTEFFFQILPSNAINECEQVTLAWNNQAQGDVAFQLVIPGGQSLTIPQTTLQQGLQGDTTGFNAVPDIRVGTNIIIVAGDSRGIGTGGSASFSVGNNPNGDNSCINANSPSSTPGIAAGAIETGGPTPAPNKNTNSDSISTSTSTSAGTSTSTSTSTSNSNSSSNGNGNSDNNNKSGNSTNLEAIVGGAVGGGIAAIIIAIIIIALVSLFCVRRMRRNRLRRRRQSLDLLPEMQVVQATEMYSPASEPFIVQPSAVATNSSRHGRTESEFSERSNFEGGGGGGRGRGGVDVGLRASTSDAGGSLYSTLPIMDVSEPTTTTNNHLRGGLGRTRNSATLPRSLVFRSVNYVQHEDAGQLTTRSGGSGDRNEDGGEPETVELPPDYDAIRVG